MNSTCRLFSSLLLILSLSGPALADETRATKILTSAIAEKALGGPVKAGSQNTMPDTEVGKSWVSKARYSLVSGDKNCGILIRHANSKEEAKTTFRDSKEKFSGVTVTGFGDEAYRITAPMPQFNVLKGSNWLIITAGTMQTGDTAAQEKIATAILPNIEGE